MFSKFRLERLGGRVHSEDLGVGGRIMKWRNFDGRVWTGFIWLGVATGGSCCEECIEPSGSIKTPEIFG
jgi:hypothetical protein